MSGTVTRIAINGLGRIGRAFLKLAIDHPALYVVAANDVADPDNLAYLMRHDSVYGSARQTIAVERTAQSTCLRIGDHRLRLLAQRKPEALPWRELRVEIVVEATGAFETFADARRHVQAGAAHVVLAAPAKDEDDGDARTVLMGVHTASLELSRVSSNGSCTTNSAASVIEVLREQIGIQKAMLNTVHGYTATQALVDSPVRGRDLRRGRAAAVNIVPSTTGAAVAVTRAIPALRERFDGISMRVPVPAGSLSSIVMLTARDTTVDEINTVLETAAQVSRWSDVLATTREPLVSSDIVGDPHVAIVDLGLTKVVDGNLCAVYSWYDNEFGFTNTLLSHVLAVAAPGRDGEGRGH